MRTAIRPRVVPSPSAADSGPRVRRLGGPFIWALLLPALALGCDEPEEVTPPLPVGGPEAPEYPLALWDEGIEGETLVRVRVDTAGRVDSVEVLEGSGHAEFDSAAVRWGRAAVFAPAVAGTDTVEVWARIPVRFRRDTAGVPRRGGMPMRPGAAPPRTPPPDTSSP